MSTTSSNVKTSFSTVVGLPFTTILKCFSWWAWLLPSLISSLLSHLLLEFSICHLCRVRLFAVQKGLQHRDVVGRRRALSAVWPALEQSPRKHPATRLILRLRRAQVQ